MNRALYLRGLKGSWKLFVIFAAVLAMYITVIVMMFDPQLGSALAELEKAMPGLMAIVGMDGSDNTLAGFMAAYLYGFVMPVFPMVYSMLTANRLVARQVDDGSMAYLVGAPVSRGRVVRTQMAVLLTGTAGLVVFAASVGLATSVLLFPGELDIASFCLLNLGALCLHLMIAGICFGFSCLFSDSKRSAAFGAGIPALGYLLQMVANYGGKLEPVKYATFFTLFDPKRLAQGSLDALPGVLILLAAAAALFCLSHGVFRRKDLPV